MGTVVSVGVTGVWVGLGACVAVGFGVWVGVIWIGAASRVGEGFGASDISGEQPISNCPTTVNTSKSLYKGRLNSLGISSQLEIPSAARYNAS